MGSSPDQTSDFERVPLFPLPNVVLFPQAVLPLHIFEERYKRMVAEALIGPRRIAMALLLPGWEKDYYSRPAIEPVVCAGQIVAHEKLADGNYNLLLQGQLRATVFDEISSGGPTPYRIGRLLRLPETAVLEIDLAQERQQLIAMFESAPLGSEGVGLQFARLLAGPMPTAEIADLLAFNFLEDLKLKQSLLAQGDVSRRVGQIVKAMDELRMSRRVLRHGRNERPGMN